MCDRNKILEDIKVELETIKSDLDNRIEKDTLLPRSGCHPFSMLQLNKLMSLVERIICGEENFHLDYLFAIKCTGAIEILRWVLGHTLELEGFDRNSEFIEGE